MSSKCKYCASPNYGHCSRSPEKVHKHVSDGKKCVYCGSTNSSGHCARSPHKVHER
jgi:hypothetical protein